MTIHIEDTETISPEDNFDNGLILGYIEKALSSESRLFTKYNHYEIYELKLSGYGVTLFVSKGNPPDFFIVPDLINISQPKAEKMILQAGFQIGELILDYQLNLVPGTVIEQNLTPGMKLSFPARINIYISTDKEIK